MKEWWPFEDCFVIEIHNKLSAIKSVVASGAER